MQTPALGYLLSCPRWYCRSNSRLSPTYTIPGWQNRAKLSRFGWAQLNHVVCINLCSCLLHEFASWLHSLLNRYYGPPPPRFTGRSWRKDKQHKSRGWRWKQRTMGRKKTRERILTCSWMGKTQTAQKEGREKKRAEGGHGRGGRGTWGKRRYHPYCYETVSFTDTVP